MKRLKTQTAAITTRDQAEAVCGEITAAMNEKRQLTAEMDAEIQGIRDAYQAGLLAIDQAVNGNLARLQDWAEANPAEFGGKRSIEMSHGRIGWRTGQPQLKPLTGWTWARVLEMLTGPLAAFVRVKPEVNKEALIAQRDEFGVDGLRAIGLRVVQAEDFFVEPKLSDVDTRVEGAAA